MEEYKLEEASSRSSSSNNNRSSNGKTSKMAWLVTFSTMLVNAACSIMWVSCASAPLTSAEWMGGSLSNVNWLSSLCAIDNSVFSLVCIWAYERFGVKRCLVFSAAINSIGSWIRCIAIALPIDKRYPVVVVGQALAGIGGPFAYKYVAVQKFKGDLASVWFAPQDRNLGATLATLSLGQIAAPLFIPAVANTGDKVPTMLYATAIIATVCAIPIMLMPGLPKVPPANSATSPRLSICEGIKQLVKSKDYWFIAIPAIVNAGMFYTMTVVIIEAAVPYGYNEQQSGIANALLMLSGFAGGGIIGYWIGRTGEHLAMIKLFTPILCGMFVMVNFQILYPIPESLSSNVTWSLVTAGMLIFTVITDSLRAGPEANPPNNMETALMVCSIIVCVGSLPVIWLKGELKRLAIDRASSI
ncbi:cell surface receptor mfs transporter [Lichtheimia corymbifera JMRC:FSU:9682]|uniref:Cell surface receptor mfs transporter n=1 Tax=Lichtheimia corymbifera JMRC:FSU:9682 TaxID=1263082 RepID=A0A068RU91_9FUNG|nr:cell surface receptor mfs transporter [Lichtheimia corymbifera JMRC:FSU:9682]